LTHFKPLASGFISTFDLHFGQRRISKSSGLIAINYYSTNFTKLKMILTQGGKGAKMERQKVKVKRQKIKIKKASYSNFKMS